LPLAIINEESGGKNPLLWKWIFIKALAKLIYTNYPQVLVLEVGTDRPGDVSYLANLIGNINVAVITDIGISHLEYFAHPEALAKEKLFLIKKLALGSAAVLNFDSPKVFDGRAQTKAETIGYGFNEGAAIQASDFQLIKAEDKWGSNFKVHYKGTVVPFFLPAALGNPAVYAALAAAGVGLKFNINLVQSSEALKNYVPPPGRLRLLPGIKHTMIIDDTYNAAPSSMIAALDALNQVATGRKLAVLGTMAELGTKTDSGHREVAAKIVESHVDLVFLVGENATIIQDELLKRNFSGRISWFENSDMARMPIQDALMENDTIMIKGSQPARMEKIVKEIMAEPQRASELLVRQSEKWINKP
ncbi:MAG: Mur ligase family protein, partial [bacterium]|nr:Mur ligase family protein [bacterium]